MTVGSNGGWLECDFVAEGFELGDESSGGSFGVGG
jgi:hypothetical protein